MLRVRPRRMGVSYEIRVKGTAYGSLSGDQSAGLLMFLLSVLAHHSEPGDPRLLAWIQDQIDALVGLGPGTIVFGLGILIVAIPVGILGVYMLDRARRRT